jgi:MoaA/NifB/PqqE/SkfB family radical SAM enzyme
MFDMLKKIIDLVKLVKNISCIKLGFPRPIIAVWEVTYGCNMRCVFCNEKNLIAEEMNTSEALVMIERLRRLKTNIILLTGGEPTIRDDIGILVDAIKKSGLTLIFTTNGLTIKKNLATLVKADLIRLSVDGYGHIHDQIRGVPGAFKKIEEGVPLLIKAGKPPMLVCVVTNIANRDNLRQLFLKAREWGVQIDFSMVTYSSKTEKAINELNAISEIQKNCRISEEEFLKMLEEFKNDFPDVLANPRFYKHLIMSGGLGKKCRALDVSLNIRPNGHISIPCDAYTLKELEGDIRDSWSKMQQLKDVKAKVGEYYFCKKCYKRCIAFPSMFLSFNNFVDLSRSYFPSLK